MRSSIKAALAFMLLVAGGALASAALADATSDEGAAASAEMEHKFEKAKKYYGECRGVDEGDFEAIKPYLKAFTDAEVMADMMSHPTKAAALMAVVNDPRTIHVMMKCSTEPVMWAAMVPVPGPHPAWQYVEVFGHNLGRRLEGTADEESR